MRSRGQHAQRLAQVLGVLERHVARERAGTSPRRREPRQLGVAREAVEHGALGRADPTQRRDDLVVRVAVVDLQGEAVALGDVDVRLERAELGRRGRRRRCGRSRARSRRRRARAGVRRARRSRRGRRRARRDASSSGASLGWSATAASRRGSRAATSADQRRRRHVGADLHGPGDADATPRGRGARARRAGGPRRRSRGGCGCRTRHGERLGQRRVLDRAAAVGARAQVRRHLVRRRRVGHVRLTRLTR